MESLNAVVTKPLMESVRALAWKVDDLKEKVERNNDLNAKMDAFGVLLVAVTDKMAVLRKVLDSTLASHKKWCDRYGSADFWCWSLCGANI